MLSPIHLRLAGYSFALAVHSYTSYDILSRLSVTTKDPIVADFATLQGRFLTIWTLALQIAYVILGLSCDVTFLHFGKEYPLTKSLDSLRETVFPALVWPTTLLVPTVFWPLFLYEETLLFPTFIDKVLSPANNIVLHGFIVPVVVWELALLEIKEKNHLRNLSLLVVYIAAYIFVLFSSFAERGQFIYPFMDRIYETIYFPLFFVFSAVFLILVYFVQWPLATFIRSIIVSTSKQSGKKMSVKDSKAFTKRFRQ